MKRISALLLTAMMIIGICAVPAGAVQTYVVSPEVEWTVDISKEVAGELADDYKKTKFDFELDVSNIDLPGDGWKNFAKANGIKYDKKREVLEFSLRAGESISLVLPFGDEYSLSEVGGFKSKDYVSTTINGEETMEHSFDVSRNGPEYQSIEVVNTYDKPNPDDPKPGEPDQPNPEDPKPSEPTPDKPDPEDPKAQEPEEPKPEKPVSPQTGYTIGIMGLSAAAAACGAVAVITGKKATKR